VDLRAPRLARLCDRLARAPAAAWLPLLLAVGLWPYLEILRLWPLTTDSVLWVSRGSLANPSWLSWAIAKRHFVFYRPVAALSYTLSDVLGGIDSLAYRGTDLALHAAVAALVFALYRELVGGRGAAALGAAAFFLAHPVGEEVLPFLARRGYLLMTGFGAASVLVFARACRRQRALGAGTAAAGALLAASLLATEVNFALVPLYPLLALHLCAGARGVPWRALRLAALPVAAAAAVYALRLAMIGDVGGYSRVEAGVGRLLALLPEAIEYPFFPSSAGGAPAWRPLGAAGAAVVIGYYVWRGALAPLRRLAVAEERISLVLWAWLAATLLLPTIFGVWFYRHAYPLLVPLSLLVAKLAADTIARERRSPWRLALHAVPQLALVAAVLHASPVVHGLDAAAMASRRVKQARMQELARALPRIAEPAVVYLVLPFEPPERPDPGWGDPGSYGMRRTGFWAQALSRGRELDFRDLAYVGPAPDGGAPGPILTRERDGRPLLVLPGGVALRFTQSYVRDQPELPLLHLDRLPIEPGRRGYVYFFNGEVGRLVELPAAGAP
jgi:hypothetical protein